MEKQCSIYALIESLHSSLDEERQELLDDVYADDRLHEIVDGTVPVYYGQLAECLQSDHALGYVDDEGLLAIYADDLHQRSSISVWNFLQVTIYERLMQEAQVWLDEQKKGGE